LAGGGKRKEKKLKIKKSKKIKKKNFKNEKTKMPSNFGVNVSHNESLGFFVSQKKVWNKCVTVWKVWGFSHHKNNLG